MIQETKDIRKEIFKQPVRKGRSEDTGTRGRGKETDSRQAGRELGGGGGGAGAVLGQTPEERAEGKGEGRAGRGAQAPSALIPFGKEQRKPGRNAQHTDHSHQPLSTKHVPRAAPALTLGWGRFPPRPPPQITNNRLQRQHARSMQLTGARSRGPGMGASADNGHGPWAGGPQGGGS